jgi:rod shape-determining protein MreD
VTQFAKGFVGFFGAMVLHWWWTTHFTVFGVAPQLLLVLTVITAARSGPVRAMCLGFVWGLFLDLLTARLFGANALALTLVGYATGSIRRQVDVTGPAPQSIVVFAMTWVYFLLIGVIAALFLKQFQWVGWAPFLLDPFYNCLLALIVFIFWQPRYEPVYR